MSMLRHISRTRLIPRRGLYLSCAPRFSRKYANLPKIPSSDSVTPSEANVQRRLPTVRMNFINPPRRNLKTGSPRDTSRSDSDSDVIQMVHASALDVCDKKGGGKKSQRGPCGGFTTMPSEDMILDVPIEINLKLNVRLEEYEISAGSSATC